ncbi:secretory pathway protein Sec39-domain-containing protein [Cyathus striatus]|nr:secretory pathway protein Sec39-domain-containing protein [Cyathus striatus]
MNPYQRWNALPDTQLTVDVVHQSLGSIQDDLWAAAACADRVLDDFSVQQALLNVGLERTHPAAERCRIVMISPTPAELASSSGSEPSLAALLSHFASAPIDYQLCKLRLVLLNRLERLNTYADLEKAVSGNDEDVEHEESDEWEDDPWADGETDGASDAPKFKAMHVSQLPISLSRFILTDLVVSACELASQECLEAVQILFQHYHNDLWKYRFAVLYNIPEHIHPSLFRDILPSFDYSLNRETLVGPQQVANRETLVDPIIDSAVAEFSSTRGGPSVACHSDIIYECHPDCLSAEGLSSWYKDRVDKILSATGMVDIALATIQHGASQGIPLLDELGEELSLLSRLVYDAPQDHALMDDWTLDRWYSMVHLKLFVHILLILPQSHFRATYHVLLCHISSYWSPARRASKPTLPAAQRLLRNDEDIVRLALACLYGSNSLDEWSTMSRIFECLPAWDISREGDNDEDAAETTIMSLGAFVKPTTAHLHSTASELLLFFQPLSLKALSRALDILDVHLESGEIFSRWSVSAPLRWFLQSNADISEQRAWANRMARRAGSSNDLLDTEEDWEWLLDDMLKLTGKGDSGIRGAFGLLSRDEVKGIFFGGLLSTGNICITCSREFYDNATSGNYKIGDMKLAYDCLDVPRSSERLTSEKQFIEATSRISSFNVQSRPGIPISPIEIRLTKDRLSLISRVLSSNIDAYKHTKVILELAHKLGFSDDPVAEIKVLAMLADTALQAEDFDRAYENSERMVEAVTNLRSSNLLGMEDARVLEGTEVCWIACFQLGRQPEFNDLSKKLWLLGRALELCPSDKIHDVLVVWRRLETEDINAREERLTRQREGKPLAASSLKAFDSSISQNVASSLKARLQDFHMPSPPLLSTPDAAALASRTFRSVAANFPFSVGHRGRSQLSDTGEDVSRRSGSQRRGENEDVSVQASRVLSKGIGWLIGADDE